MPTHRSNEDDKLLRSVLANELQAWEAFVRKVADVVWISCSVLCRDEGKAKAAFSDVFEALKANDFLRLRHFNGTGSIQTFVTLCAREILAERLMRLFSEGLRDEAWAAFEHFFRKDIERILWRRMPSRSFDEARREAYQEICLAFVADNYRRIRSFGGSGSFTGFILQTVDRLAIDHIRRTASRRRMPTAVVAMGEAEQRVFRLVHWEGMPADVGLLAAETGQSTEAVAKTLDRIRSFQPAPVTISIDETDVLPSEDRTPEAILIGEEEERVLSVAAQAMLDATEDLSDTERLYVNIVLGGGNQLPAREVARLMGRPVEEVYKLKQRVMGRLRDALDKNPAVKLWRASV